MIKELSLLFILFSPALEISFPQSISIHGYGNAGYIIYNRAQYNNEYQLSYFEGKLKTDVQYVEKIDGQIYFKANSPDHYVKLEELNLRFHLWDYFYLRFGNMKKPFGYEYLEAEEELQTINRSFANEEISDMGYTGKALE